MAKHSVSEWKNTYKVLVAIKQLKHVLETDTADTALVFWKTVLFMPLSKG